MKSRAAHPERRAGRQRDSLAEAVLSNRLHSAPDVIGSRSLQGRDAFEDIVRRHDGMAIHADDDLSPRLRQGQAKAGWHNSTWIVDHGEPNLGVSFSQTSDRLPRAIFRLAVGDQHLQKLARILLLQNRAKTSLR